MSSTLAGKEVSCVPEAGVGGKQRYWWGGESTQGREVCSGRENGSVPEAGRSSAIWYRCPGSCAALH